MQIIDDPSLFIFSINIYYCYYAQYLLPSITRNEKKENCGI